MARSKDTHYSDCNRHITLDKMGCKRNKGNKVGEAKSWKEWQSEEKKKKGEKALCQKDRGKETPML